jgi:ATP-dependent helicase/nuclease subunit B
VLGLDAVRFPGAALHDTLLGDDERRRLARDAPFSAVPTAGERLGERRYALAALLARLRGPVTLSYSAWDAAEARTVAPAAEVLQSLRLRERDPTADYERLHRLLGTRASAVPRGTAPLDAADVWLGSLAGAGVLLHGVDAVRAGFPGLDGGLRAAETRASAGFTAHHGRIVERPAVDPRGESGAVVSTSRLETLGTCPLRYLMRWVLEVRPPYETEFRADRWLTPLDRGSLLHDLYRRALEQQRTRGVSVSEAAFEDVALDALEIELGRWRERVPPPGEATFAVEAAQLADDVRAFVRMTRETGADWVALEYRFGYPDRGPRALPAEEATVPRTPEPVLLELKDGPLRISGRIDRIDRAEDGRLVVIDYKTGGAEAFGRRTRIFNRGRRLQHALYMEAVERLLGPVTRAEYHFPTQRGETQRAVYEADSLRWGTRIVNGLLNLAARGWFHPTVDAADCRFCDFNAVCRAQPGRKTGSPLAAWSAAAVESLPELAVMRALMRERD